MLLSSLSTTPDALFAATGWDAKSQGLCRGEICVPASGSERPDGTIDVSVVAERLAMPLVHDEAANVWALGPSILSGRALDTAVVPPLSLTTLDGNPFDFTSLLGRKVILAAWASW
jgi:hypothetical protein